MVGQMSIFEFLPQASDFMSMPESEIMDTISRRIGVKLAWDSHLEEYSAKVGKTKIRAEIDTYSCTHDGSETIIEGHKFIGTGWSRSTEGGGRPCDSIDEAVEYLLKAITKKKGVDCNARDKDLHDRN